MLPSPTRVARWTLATDLHAPLTAIPRPSPPSNPKGSQKRKKNEDSFLVSEPLGLFIVADEVG